MRIILFLPTEHLVGVYSAFMLQFGIMLHLEYEARCAAFFLIFVTLFEYGIFRLVNWLLS